MNVLTDHITLATHLNRLMVHNKSSVGINRLVYCSWQEYYLHAGKDGSKLYNIQSVPFYELSNIPAQAFALLENIEHNGEERQRHKIVRIDWEDGHTLEHLLLEHNDFENWEHLPELPYSDIPKRFLKNVRPEKGPKTEAECLAFAKSLA